MENKEFILDLRTVILKGNKFVSVHSLYVNFLEMSVQGHNFLNPKDLAEAFKMLEKDEK